MPKLKLQPKKYEKGEFSKTLEVDIKSFLRIYRGIYTQKNTTKHSWSLKYFGIKLYLVNDELHYLRIDHYSKDMYYVYYYNKHVKEVLYGTFYYKDVEKIAALYFKKEFASVKKVLVKGNLEIDEMLYSFRQKDFVYKYENSKASLFNASLILNYALIVVSIILVFRESEMYNFWLTAIIILCVLQLYKYYKYTRYKKIVSGIKIKITKNNSRFKYTFKRKEKELNKAFVRKIVYHEHSGLYNPIPGCSYSKIILKNGEYLILPDEVINHYDLLYKFSSYKIKVKTKNMVFARLEEPSKLF